MKQPFTASSSSSSSSSSLIRKARLSPYLLTLLVFIVFVAILYGEDFMCLLGQLDPNLDRPATSRTGELTRSVVIRFLTLSVLYLYMIRLLFFSLKKVFLCKKRVVD
jgi:hypothetical protein